MIQAYTFSILACGAVLPAAFLAGDVGIGATAQRGTIAIEIPGQPTQNSQTIEDAVAMAKAGRRNGIEQPIVITLPSGVIHLTKPIAFTDSNGGTAKSPLIIRGQPDGSSVISGAVPIARDTSAEISVDLARVAPGFKPDLTATSTETGSPANRLVLFQDHRLLSLSSWPEKRYATDWKTLPGSNILRLTAANAGLPKGNDLVAAGYISQDWQYQAVNAQSDGTSLTLKGDDSTAFQKTVRLKLLNVPGPLGVGRYALDQTIVKVRGFGSQAPVEMASATSLFTFDGAHDVRIEAVALEKTRGTAVTISNSDAISLTDCFIGLTGGYGVDAADSRNIHVERCVVSQTGGGGVRLNGGDRATLQPAHNWVQGSRIVDFGQSIRTYAPGVALTGVGNSVSGSFIGGAPHAGIVIAGNDHLVEDNELGFLVCETNDASAIYMGRDWTQRGNRLTRNFIHDVGPGTTGAIVSGIYLDDQFSGAQIDHNVMVHIPHGIYIGGGRDNHINDNIFAAMARSAVWIDDRGMNWQKDAAGPNGVLQKTLKASPYLSRLWRTRYPSVSNLLNNRPGYPIGNTATDNTSIDGQFLWASPMTLKIPGIGNQEMPITTPQKIALASGTARQQYLAIRGANSTKQVPGLQAKLLFANRASNATMCPAS
jgi:hypothetical protein